MRAFTLLSLSRSLNRGGGKVEVRRGEPARTWQPGEGGGGGGRRGRERETRMNDLEQDARGTHDASPNPGTRGGGWKRRSDRSGQARICTSTGGMQILLASGEGRDFQ